MKKLFLYFLLFCFICNATVYAQESFKLNVDTRNYDQQHIKVTLTIDFDEQKIEGTAHLRFIPLTDGFDELILHTKSTVINEVKINDKSLLFEIKDDLLFITLDKVYPKGNEIEVEINYVSHPSRGLYFFKPTEEIPEIPYQVWSQGQGEYNRHWIPAYDQPDDRLTSELIVTVPDNMIVISNGNLQNIHHNEERSTKTFHWIMEETHPLYLITLIAGEYITKTETVQGVALEYNLPPDHTENIDYYYGRTPQMMQFFSDYLIPYPYKRYAQTTVQDFEWGGMENTTATTLNRRIHYDHRAIPNYSADALIAHELAHQWFGDLLTCKTWDHIWLNEGITTYFTDLWHENEFGLDEMRFRRFEQNQSYIGSLNEEPFDKLIPHESGVVPVELSGRTAYSRGAAITHALRFELGDDLFQKGMREYVTRFANHAVVSEQLRKVLEEVSGKNLNFFFKQWVYGAGFPEFEVSYEYDDSRKELILNVKQIQEHFPARGLFNVPVLVDITAGSQKISEVIRVSKEEENYSFKVNKKPDLVRFNKYEWILSKKVFKKSFDELVYQLHYDDDVVGRHSAASQLKDFGKEAIPHLRRAILRDKFYAVRMNAVESLKHIGGEDVFEHLVFAANDFDARVRESAVKAFAIFDSEKIKSILLTKLNDLSNDYVRGAAAYSIGSAKLPGAFEILKEALKHDSHRNIIRRGAFDGFAGLSDPRVLPLVKEYIQYKYSYGGMHLLDIHALDCAMKFSDSHREEVLDILVFALHNPYFRTRNYAAKLIADLNGKEKLPVLYKILELERRLVVKEPLRQAIKRLEDL